jgi:exodeoxyribonuclease VIII
MKRDVEVIRGMPIAEYLAIPAASSSALRLLGTRSPAHLQADREQPREETAALTIGTAAHVAILEPDLFGQYFAVGPVDDRRTKDWKAFATECSEAKIGALRPMDMALVDAMRTSVRAHPAARKLLDLATERELTIVWVDEGSQVVCKARIDLLVPEIGATVELKTAFDAGRTGFEKAIWNHGYYTQGAWYIGAANRIADRPCDFANHAIIALEKDPPYATNAFLVRDEAIQAGRDQLDRWLRRYAECEQSGTWPCESAEYSTQFMDITLPPWAQRSIEERTAA